MRPALIMHVNYCEQGQSLQEICAKAVDWGFDGVEFRCKRAGIEESAEQYLEALDKAVKKTGLREVVFGAPGPNFAAGDEEKRRAELNEYATFCETAHRIFHTTLFNVFAGAVLNSDPLVHHADCARHGSSIAMPAQWQWTVEGFKALMRRLEPLGLRLGFETHAGYLHDLPETAMRLVDGIASPSIGVTFDYANTVLFPDRPPSRESLASLSDKLFYVHLKNLLVLPSGGHLRVGLADGQINNRELLRELQQAGYAGPLCIEAPRPGDREWYAQQDLAYLRSLLDDLGWN